VSSIDESTLLDWTRRELLLPAAHLAYAWGCDIRTLTAACKRGDLFLIEFAGERWCLQWMTQESRDEVQRLCRAHGSVDPLAALEFWHEPHEKLKGRRPGMTIGDPDFDDAVDLAREFGVAWRAQNQNRAGVSGLRGADALRELAEAVWRAVRPDGSLDVDDEPDAGLAKAWRSAAAILGEEVDRKPALAAMPSWLEMPVLSVTHLRGETRRAIRAGQLPWYAAIYGTGEVLGIPVSADAGSELPEDLTRFAEWARNAGHRWVRLDYDGDVVDDLPRYRRSAPT
jgi:hypothetical protein